MTLPQKYQFLKDLETRLEQYIATVREEKRKTVFDMGNMYTKESPSTPLPNTSPKDPDSLPITQRSIDWNSF